MTEARQPDSSPAAGTAIESLLVVVYRGSAPFCNYVNPHYQAAKPQWTPLDVLDDAMRFAREKRLRLILLLGRHPLPRRHAEVVRGSDHLAIVPWAVRRRYDQAIPVLEVADVAAAARSNGATIDNAILRLGREAMPRLASLFRRLAPRLRRLNVCLFDVGHYREEDLDAYQKQREALVRTVADLHWPAAGTECNLVTDRVMLRTRNHCDAGAKHVTVAPNGRFYLCPGFYYRDEADSIGSLGDGIQIKNAHLLSVEYAPVCRRCEAYHCRRCLLLNKQLTEEINTPSRQQCVTAHYEREASRELLDMLRHSGRLNEAMPVGEIRKLDYLDPFELVKRGATQDGRQPAAASETQTPEQAAADGEGQAGLLGSSIQAFCTLRAWCRSVEGTQQERQDDQDTAPFHAAARPPLRYHGRVSHDDRSREMHLAVILSAEPSPGFLHGRRQSGRRGTVRRRYPAGLRR